MIFIDGFTSRMKAQSTAYLLSGSAHIYWIWDLEGEAHQYGIRSQAAFKNARVVVFLKLGGADSSFRAGAKISREGWPRPDLTPPIVRRGS